MCTDHNHYDRELVSDIKSRMILHWNYRNLKELPKEVLEYGDHIEEIYLKRNCLEKLPKSIGKLCNLTNLYLVGNQLEELPIEIGELINLKVLDLSQNYIKGLPSTLGELEGLESLLLTYNQLELVPKCVSRLKNLKTLEVSGNRINYLSEEVIKGLEKLEEFGIDRNPLSSIPRNICGLSKLRYFSACRCNLLFLPSLPFYLIRGGSGGSNQLQYLFDGNPKLNYLPYWALHTSHLECFGCGLDPGDNSSNNSLQLYSPTPPILGPQLTVTFKGRQRSLHFDPDLLKIHHRQPSAVSSLLELCLRIIDLHSLLQEDFSSKPVVEPIIIPVKASSPHFIKIRGPEPETTPKSTTSTTTLSPLIPHNLKRILDKGPIAKCFECLKPIFTETWPIIFSLEEDQEGKVALGSAHFCSSKCISNLKSERISIDNQLEWN